MVALLALGPDASYGHRVRNWVNEKRYGESSELMFAERNEDILMAADGENSRADQIGLVPMYNSTAALVSESVKFWMGKDDQRKFFIQNAGGHPYSRAEVIGKVSMRIRHFLLVRDSNVCLEDIKAVVSHQQGLVQCADHIKQYLTNATLMPPVSSTSGAAAYVNAHQDPSIAAIGSRFCAETYGLHALMENFEDDPRGNYTHFYAIANKMRIVPVIQNSKIAFLLWPRENVPGVLEDLASPMGRMKIDIKFITSIPLGGTYNEASGEIDEDVAFFVEMDTHPNRHVMESVLTQLAWMSRKLVILGSFDNWGVIQE